ncbi:MAG: ATP-binding cassette domain-containing protein, partial [Acidobacteriota bacterium]
RGKLGMVLFSGDEVEKKLSSLSGGEATRLVFAKLGIAKPNILVLDEPTNHLDIEAIEALVAGLRDFDGTLIFVSHDRWFVSQLADRIIEISADGINDYRGTYDEYVERCGDDHLDVETAVLRAKRDKKKRSKGEDAPKNSADEAARKKRLKAAKKERDEVTADIEKAEARVDAINEMFCNPGFFDDNDPKEIRRLETEQKTLETRIQELMETWENLETELAELADVA